ncbi:MAG TPA: GntR family transcriptional regulator [Planctomycetota bacterium]|nr:GntR family transcriptional regulator [Planctomycetota bacterium]
MGLRGLKPHVRDKAVSDIETGIRDGKLWGQRLPAEREMAGKLGISRFTLQSALSVLESRGLVIRRHGSGTFAAGKPGSSAAAKGGKVRVAVIAPGADLAAAGWTYHGDMVRGALRGCQRLGIEALPLPLEEVWTESPGPRWGEARECDAFAVVSAHALPMVYALLKLRRAPVALLDGVLRDVPVIAVVDGSFEGARRAVRYLAKLGHRRIAYLTPREDAETPHAKSHGYRAALDENGIAYDPGLVCPDPGDAGEAHIPEAVDRLLALPDPPTAVFAGNDRKAMAAWEALEACGRRPGADVALVGFGDTASRSGAAQGLSSVRILTRRMGELAVKALVDAGGRPAARTVIVPDTLMIRGSTCPPGVAARSSASEPAD